MTFVNRNQGPEVGALAGQSNSLGRMTPPPTVVDPSVPRADVRYWYHDLAFVEPTVSQDLDYYDPAQWTGGEVVLGVGMADGGRAPYAVAKTARGSTGLVNPLQWAPSSSVGELSKSLRSLRSFLDRLVFENVNTDPRISLVVWNQWEEDGKTAAASAAYQENLSALIARFRAEIHPALPFVVTLASTAATSRPAQNIATIRAAQLAVAAADPLVVTIETNDVPIEGDNTHYTMDGQQTPLGTRVRDAALAFPAPIYNRENGVLRVSFYNSIAEAREIASSPLLQTCVRQGPIDKDVWAVEDRFSYHHVPEATWAPV